MKLILDIVLQHTGNFGEEHLCPMFSKDYTQPLSNINKSMKLHENSKLPSNYFSLKAKDQYESRLGLMKNTRGKNEDTQNLWHHYAHFNWTILPVGGDRSQVTASTSTPRTPR